MAVKFEVRFTRSAARDLRKLPPDVQARIRKAVAALQEDPHLGKPLVADLQGLWSYGQASYRLIYQIQGRKLLVLAIAIGHRREIYERARRRKT